MKKSIILAVLISAVAITGCAKKKRDPAAGPSPKIVTPKDKPTPTPESKVEKFGAALRTVWVGECQAVPSELMNFTAPVASSRRFVAFSKHSLEVTSKSYADLECNGPIITAADSSKTVGYVVEVANLGDGKNAMIQTFVLRSGHELPDHPTPIRGDNLDRYLVRMVENSLEISSDVNADLFGKNSKFTRMGFKASNRASK